MRNPKLGRGRPGTGAVAVLLLLLVASCGDGAVPDRSPSPSPLPSSPSGSSPSGPVGPSGPLVVWADASIGPVLGQLGRAAGVELTIRDVAVDLVPSQLATPSPSGQAPDIVALAHESLGLLVEGGALAPVDPGAGGDGFLPVSTAAFSVGGSLYGVPFAVENVALIRNTELVPDPPATFEELERTALQLEGDGKVDFPFGLPVPDPYHEYPLFTALGGSVFGTNPDGTPNGADLRLDSPGSLAAASAFGRWRSEGLIDPEVTIDAVIEVFDSAKSPFAVTGPWMMSDPARGFEGSGVPFSVEPIPPVQGVTPRPFVRVLGLAVPASAPNRDAAATFLAGTIATPEAQARLAVAVDRAPALTAALDDPSLGPELRGFGLSAGNGDPLPAIPEMTQVWGPWADAYAKIFNQSAQPQQAFREAAAAIRTAIETGAGPSAPGDA